MSQYWIIVAILRPICGGIATRFLPFKKQGHMVAVVEVYMIATSAIVWGLLAGGTTKVFHVVHFINDLFFTFLLQLHNVFQNLLRFNRKSAEMIGTDINQIIDSERGKSFFVGKNQFRTLVTVVPGAISPRFV